MSIKPDTWITRMAREHVVLEMSGVSTKFCRPSPVRPSADAVEGAFPFQHHAIHLANGSDDTRRLGLGSHDVAMDEPLQADVGAADRPRCVGS